MSETSANNKRIAKNTLLLYVRMLFLMLVSLYTSRVILNALGIADYGVYNVVGGFISMFSILSGSFSASVSRFLTFELGKGNVTKLSRVFSSSVIIQVTMAVTIILLAEVIGNWFLNYKMNIPADRLYAANWVMHFSILTFAFNLIGIPYNAAIIAHERMNVFAYISIIEAMLKLLVAYVITISLFDKLIVYSVLLFCIAVLIPIIYAVYCKNCFEECTFHFLIDKKQINEMTGFAGWTLLGNGAYMFNTQGVNILINMFFGVTLNAARGIASQVEQAVLQFVNNFTTAINPQITKSYAEGRYDYMHTLVCRGAKYSYFLMLLFAVPIWIETEQILTLWLKIVPDYAIIFVRLTIVTSMCTVIGNTLVTSQLATGEIRKYQITVTVWGLWVFPLTWVAFTMGCAPVWAYLIYTFVYFVLIFIRIYLVKDLIRMPWQKYVRGVLLRCLEVTAIAIVIPMSLSLLQEPSIIRFVQVLIVGELTTIGCIYYIGLDQTEKEFVIQQIKKRIKTKNYVKEKY